MRNLAARIFSFVASYGVAVVLLFFLLLLTFFGTIEQVNHGLFEVQKKYFESAFLVHNIPLPGGNVLPLPLPGVYLLLSLLFVNMSCGAIIRARKDWRHPGMLIAHGGILFLVLAGFVTYEFSISGHMTLYEGEQADNFDSYYDWEITITELAEGGKRYTIPGDQFQYMNVEDNFIFTHAELPFDLLIEGWLRNCWPAPEPPGQAMGIDGIILDAHPLEKEAERNIAGATVSLVEKGQNPGTHEALLWGLAPAPWIATVAGKEYAVDLHHKQFPVPFTIRLDRFIRDLHPRTAMAANFESEVSQIERGLERKANIKMNAPLRDRGFTFFQASWGPENAGPGERLFSTFAVVNNPADQWPKYACYIIGLGLSIHFIQKLLTYLRRESKKRAGG